MRKIYLILAVLGLFFSRCSNKFVAPEVPLPQCYIYSSNMDTLANMVDIQWWEKFGDTTLNRLIITAIANNRDVVSAMASLEQSRLAISTSRANYLPSVEAEAAGDAFYNSEDKIMQIWGLGARMSWELSLFGGMKNTTRAARAAYLSTEQGAKAVMLSIAAQVATTYFTLMSYQSSLEISTRSYELRRQSTALIDSLNHYGMASRLNLEQARSLTQAAAADIPLYKRAIAQTSLALNILLGENPSAIIDPSCSPFENLESCADLIPVIPIGIPSELLERRPDVMEAYYSMVEAWANVGIKRAARYPSISLSGSGGVGASVLKDIFSGEPFIWSATAALAQPIFAFGSYKRAEQIAREKLYASTANYEQSILEAISEVEQALVAISTYKDQIEKYAQLLSANYSTQQISTSLYDNGLSAYLDVIDAERTWYQSQLEYVSILSEQYINYIDLYKALGGGW